MTLTNCSLRSLTVEDLPRVIDLAADPELYPLMLDSFEPPLTVEGMEWLVYPENHHYGVEAGGELVGIIGVDLGRDIERFNGEINGWLGRQYWRRGLGRTALKLFTDYVFQTLPVHRLFTKSLADNTPIIRVLQKAGWEAEGLFKDGAFKNGKFKDIVVFAKRRNDVRTV